MIKITADSSTKNTSHLADRHPVVPTTDLDDCARQIGAFVDLALPAMFVATSVACLREGGGRRSRSVSGVDETTPYVGWALHAFAQVEIKGLQRKTFQDYYVDERDPEEVAEESDRSVGFEIERRRVFLSSVGAALKAEIARISREVCPEPARADLRSSPWLRTLAARELLGRRAAKAGR